MDSMYDFIIVGAGPAGCVLASRLAKCSTKPSVLLLEAGGSNSELENYSVQDRFNIAFKPNSPLNWGYKVRHQDREIDYSRGKGLGGSTAINFCGWVTGPRQDYEEWARIVDDEAFGWKNAKRCLDSIVCLHRDVPHGYNDLIKPSPEHGGNGAVHLSYGRDWQDNYREVFQAAKHCSFQINQDVNDGDPIGMGVGTTCIYDGVRITSATAFTSDVPPNLTILPDSHVSKVILNDKRATGVEILDRHIFHAKKEVILSCGAINTPHLLQLSGIGPEEFLTPCGVEIRHPLDQVGRNLQDHCFSTAGVVLKGATPKTADQNPSPMGWFKLPGMQESEEFLDLPEPTQQYLSEPTVPAWELVAHVASLMPAAVEDGEEVNGAMAILMNPQSRGVVRLVSPDPGVAPHIDPMFLNHPFDRRMLIEAMKELLNFLQAPIWKTKTVRTLDWPEDLSDGAIMRQIQSKLRSSWHMCGTVRMGKSSKDACVDSDFHVMGLDGLRVADMSVCPLVPNNHTQSTAYVIGAIAAQKVIAEHGLDH